MTLPKQPSSSFDDDDDDDVDDDDVDDVDDDDDAGADDNNNVDDDDVAFRDGVPVPVQFDIFAHFGMPLHPFCCWVHDAIFCDGAITLGRTFIVFAVY